MNTDTKNFFPISTIKRIFCFWGAVCGKSVFGTKEKDNKGFTKSPLAPTKFPTLPGIKGVEIATMEVGFVYRGRPDYFLARLAKGTVVAGVFTTSKTCSTVVDYAKAIVKGSNAVTLIAVSAGNANAFTGEKGRQANLRFVDLSKKIANVAADVIPCNTGIIGEVLDTKPLESLKEAQFTATWKQAAKAIVTTDTFAKGSVATAKIGDKTVNIVGIAKGSGMIAPHLATMLAYVFTDARISRDQLQALTEDLMDVSFNAITVDSDTSTSDSVIVCATGKANNVTGDLSDFTRALRSVFQDLAKQIVRDGEGARKFITVNVTGAESDRSAKKIAFSIANSPLVKTAIAGEDANWGRIVMAIGKSGENVDRDLLEIAIGNINIVKKGEIAKQYDEALLNRHLQRQNIVIDVDIHKKQGAATVWTCDLTHGYIDINASYRS